VVSNGLHLLRYPSLDTSCFSIETGWGASLPNSPMTMRSLVVGDAASDASLLLFGTPLKSMYILSVMIGPSAATAEDEVRMAEDASIFLKTSRRVWTHSESSSLG